MRALVAKGRRAKLASANLITGQMLVDLDFVKDAEPAELTMDGTIGVIPTVDGDFGAITASVSAILRKVNQLPFAEIAANLNETLRGANNIANGAELKQALTALSATLVSVQDLVQQVDTDIGPVMKKLPASVAALNEALARVGRLSTSVESGYGDNSKFRRDLDRLMEQLNDTARSLRVLTDTLSRNPEALIRGRTGTEPRP